MYILSWICSLFQLSHAMKCRSKLFQFIICVTSGMALSLCLFSVYSSWIASQLDFGITTFYTTPQLRYNDLSDVLAISGTPPHPGPIIDFQTVSQNVTSLGSSLSVLKKVGLGYVFCQGISVPKHSLMEMVAVGKEFGCKTLLAPPHLEKQHTTGGGRYSIHKGIQGN